MRLVDHMCVGRRITSALIFAVLPMLALTTLSVSQGH
jgi:hypothetical protein